MCSAFSQLQTMNRNRMGESKYHHMVNYALVHLRFCMKLYQMQINNGMYFLHEHPANASVRDGGACSCSCSLKLALARCSAFVVSDRSRGAYSSKTNVFLQDLKHIKNMLKNMWPARPDFFTSWAPTCEKQYVCNTSQFYSLRDSPPA